MARSTNGMLIKQLTLCLSLLIFVIQGPRQVTAADSFELVGVKVAVSKADGLQTLPGTYPKDVVTGTDLQPDETLQVSLSIKAGGETIKPHQVMLLLTAEASGSSAYAVGKLKGTEYTIQATHATIERQLGKQSGPFKVALLVGDSSVTQGLRWELGTLNVKPFTSKGEPAPAVRTAVNQQHVFTKAEIIHMHRAPEKRPPSIVSLAFTGLAFVPLVVLFGAVLSLKPNFKAWPSGAASLAALAFHGSMAAAMFLYLIFWLQLTLVQTIPLALLLGLFIAISGFQTLSAVASARNEDTLKKRE